MNWWQPKSTADHSLIHLELIIECFNFKSWKQFLIYLDWNSMNWWELKEEKKKNKTKLRWKTEFDLIEFMTYPIDEKFSICFFLLQFFALFHSSIYRSSILDNNIIKLNFLFRINMIIITQFIRLLIKYSFKITVQDPTQSQISVYPYTQIVYGYRVRDFNLQYFVKLSSIKWPLCAFKENLSCCIY